MNTATADGSRALYGISKDGLTIKELGRLNRWNVPGFAMSLDMVINILFVLFVGNLHPAVQRERMPWLARLAGLGDRRRVVIQTGVFGEAYRALLARSRIVFNRSIRGECNLRVFEAAAAGALQAAGARHIYLAGRPGEQEAALRGAGVGNFIFAGGDALATLRDAYGRME